ncbi:MAG TPA: hypothetical protein PKY50_08390 [Candidatus Competibacter sp.]|nr:hypothetical protein [Candidatus Competibacter sp.]
MKLTGVEVPAETLSKVEPNTVLMVISDENGKLNVVKVGRDSISQGEPLVRVAGGCWVLIEGRWVWKDPCPN